MSFQAPNLSRRPFANTRPIVRITILLWVVGSMLAIGNFLLYGRSLFGIESAKDTLVELEEEIREERRLIAEATSSLRALDLDEQNEEASYLNQQIDKRAFSWSRLFEDLSDVLPLRVRLFSLAPRTGGAQRGRSVDSRVRLEMVGAAENDQALLDFLDRLFQSPSFDRPVLPREQRATDGSIEFSLAVQYEPGGRDRGTRIIEAPTIEEPHVDDGLPPAAADAAAPPPEATPAAPEGTEEESP